MKKPVMYLSRSLKWFFVISHVAGWIASWIQTNWLVSEIRKHKE